MRSIGYPYGLFTFLKTEALYVDGLFLCHPLLDGGLLKSLAGTELADCTGLFEFAFEALQCAFDVVAVFDGYYDHSFITSFFFGAAKIEIFFLIVIFVLTFL